MNRKINCKSIYLVIVAAIICCFYAPPLIAVKNDDASNFDFKNVSICPVAVDELEVLSNDVYQYVFKRMNISKDVKIQLEFKEKIDGENINGLTSYPSEQSENAYKPPVLKKDGTIECLPLNKITIFIKDGVAGDYISGVMAHETGHVAIGAVCIRSTCQYLIEGFATWLAGDYWLGWHKMSAFPEGFDSSADIEDLLSLDQKYSYIHDPGKRMKVYNEWASFVGFLINSRGIEKFKKFIFETAPEPPIKDFNIKSEVHENIPLKEIDLTQVKFVTVEISETEARSISKKSNSVRSSLFTE